ncbi:insulin-induced protein-domain-containing protein [Cladorrhinum samala]|uniref:Insulin-induced protein-domain-containing protein n=1 Tax=Cladorrhinum samala TaxID=585594 RepID=A0AAV9HPD4_9PEZI|nr:insulin-induced protein-domain-containing protein [Cladorrhinum samala]
MDSSPDPASPSPTSPDEAPIQQSYPEILRPIPRRPFRLNFTSPTPPEEDSAPSSAIPTPSITASDLRFLDIHNPSPRQPQSQTQSSSITRAASLLNLTGSTLLGIYSPTLTPGIKGDEGTRSSWLSQTPLIPEDEEDEDEDDEDDDDEEYDDHDYHDGRHLSAREKREKDPTYQIIKARRESFARPRPSFSGSSSSLHAQQGISMTQHHDSTSSVILRSAVLFTLGVGFGVLVTHLPSQQSAGPASASASALSLPFWGTSALVLGLLLPKFDTYFSSAGGSSPRKAGDAERPTTTTTTTTTTMSTTTAATATTTTTDWPLLVRSVGAFIGIMFAIRRLPWTSTLQLSLTLALANPFLWYLIDRSLSGFIMSSAVGILGGLVMLGTGLGEGVVPAPFFSIGGVGGVKGHGNDDAWNPEKLGEMGRGVWMLSVMFCSCVCFGNIGRRLGGFGGGQIVNGVGKGMEKR